MRKSARAGSAAQSAAPNAQSAKREETILSMVDAVETPARAPYSSRMPRCQLGALSLAVEPPVGASGANYHHLAERLARQEPDDSAIVVGDIERRGALTLEALEHAFDRSCRANAVDA
jgi:hypothetical protein